MLHQAFLAVYPTDGPVERPHTQAARQAARDASGSSDSEANTDDVTGDLSSIEELSEEEMEDPPVTAGPFTRDYPRAEPPVLPVRKEISQEKQGTPKYQDTADILDALPAVNGGTWITKTTPAKKANANSMGPKG